MQIIKKYSHESTNSNFSMSIVWIIGGSNNDSKGKKGINQILSSMLSRGCEGFNNFEFSEYIYSHGAELNQEIYEDGILISLKSLNEHFHKLLPLIDLMILRPTLSEDQFQLVKKSSINSIKKERENLFNIVYEKWRKLIYKNHPYAFNCIGYEEDISKIEYKDILLEYKEFKSRDKYLISNNIKYDLNNQIIDNKFYKGELNNIAHNSNQGYRFVDTYQKSNQTILMLGNQTCSRFDNDYISLKVLESYLSYGMSSVLFKFFREKNGITYDVGIYNSPRRGNSPFLVYLSVSNKNALLAFKLLKQLWTEILSSQITQDGMKLAKEKLKSSFLLSNQSLEEILQRKIQLISYYQNPKFDEEYLEKIEKVSAPEILQITNKYFSKPFLSVLGQEETCKQIKENWISGFL